MLSCIFVEHIVVVLVLLHRYDVVVAYALMLLLMVAAPASETSSVGSSHAQIAVFLLVTVAASFVKKTDLFPLLLM